MSEILITRKHRLTAKKARHAAELVASDLQQEYNLNYEWGDDGALHFDRSGLHGRLILTKGDGIRGVGHIVRLMIMRLVVRMVIFRRGR